MSDTREPSPDTTLTPDEMARFSRHIILPGIGREGQERLKRARVLCIGLGGLGSPAAMYLAAGGVGTLGLVDFDRVEAHNLHRQVIHDTPHIGRPKVESAGERLAALNPHTRLEPQETALAPENVEALFEGYDIIVDGSDNFATRYLVSDAAALLGKPLVYGSVFQFEGQVSLFCDGPDTPCYRCLFPRPPEPGSVPNCAEAGVFGALCGVVGSLQAMEAIKWITGAGDTLAGRLLVVDALGSRLTTLRLKKDPDCPLCGSRPEITGIDPTRYAWECDPPTEDAADARVPDPLDAALGDEVDVATAAALLREHPEAVEVLDVREPYEVEICRIRDSRQIPMRQVPAQADALPRDKRLLVLCHHGGRSLNVTRYLRDRGFAHATNIRGGIHQWAIEIDPDMRKY